MFHIINCVLVIISERAVVVIQQIFKKYLGMINHKLK